MTGILVRKIEQKDKEEFERLINEYIEESVGKEKIYPVEFRPAIGERYWTDINKNKKYLVVVAQHNDRLVGLGIGEVHMYGSIEKMYFVGDRRGEMWDLYVTARMRGQGVGRLIIKELEKLFAERGCENVVLNQVSVKNEKAKKLYEKLGYKAWTERFYKNINTG